MNESPRREPRSDKQESQDRESYLRWQELAITQLGYTINIFLTLAGAALGFGLDVLVKRQPALISRAHFLFEIALPLLGLSIIGGLFANVTRAQDFRHTRRAARERMKGGKRGEEFHEKAELYGKWTWRLFYAQTGTFGFGVLLLALSVWLAATSSITGCNS